MDTNEQLIRKQLIRLLRGEAHMGFDEAVADYPMDRLNDVPPKGLYSVWQLLEHLRFTQADILAFITDPDYAEPKWPDDYWPKKDQQADSYSWQRTIDSFKSDLEELVTLVKDPKTDLYSQVPWGDGQTYFEEFVKVSDHNAYHIGELGITRQIMGTWPEKRNQ